MRLNLNFLCYIISTDTHEMVSQINLLRCAVPYIFNECTAAIEVWLHHSYLSATSLLHLAKISLLRHKGPITIVDLDSLLSRPERKKIVFFFK